MKDAVLPAPQTAQQLEALGALLRARRKQQKVTTTAAAETAGLSRMTWHRIERGEPGVSVGAWLSAAEALGLQLELIDPRAPTAAALPDRIRLADYPQLRKLAWQLSGVEDLSHEEALSLYERNWRHVEVEKLTPQERALIQALTATRPGGRLLV